MKGFRSKSSIQYFNDNTIGFGQRDVLISLLFSQLAAHKKHKFHSEHKKWINYYNEVGAQLGWQLNKFYFNKLSGNNKKWKIENLLIEDQIEAIFKSDIELLQKQIEFLTTTLTDDKIKNHLISDSIKEQTFSFLLQCISRSQSESIILSSVYISIESQEKIIDPFNQIFKTTGATNSMIVSSYKFNINQYQLVKQQVEEKLNTLIQTLTDEIKL